MNPFNSAPIKCAIQCLLVSLAACIFAVSAMSQAQATAADLTGTVVDPNDAVVGGATVTAKYSHRTVATSTTDQDGTYKFIGLPPGEYEIGAEAANFKKMIISPVKLTVGQSAELKIRLEIGDSRAPW